MRQKGQHYKIKSQTSRIKVEIIKQEVKVRWN